MALLPHQDYAAEVARGRIPNWTSVDRFGEATGLVSGVHLPVWDGAEQDDAHTKTYVVRSSPQIYALVVSSTHDNGNTSPLGTGMRTIEVSGLKDWDTAETTETVVLSGAVGGGIGLANQYVAINRLKGKTYGSAEANQDDILCWNIFNEGGMAHVLSGNGQTLQAMYAIASGQQFLVTSTRASVESKPAIFANDSSGAKAVITMHVYERPDNADGGWNIVDRYNVSDASHYSEIYYNPIRVQGPAVIQMRAMANFDGMKATAGFTGYLVNGV
jgi:hypothetical protein